MSPGKEMKCYGQEWVARPSKESFERQGLRGRGVTVAGLDSGGQRVQERPQESVDLQLLAGRSNVGGSVLCKVRPFIVVLSILYNNVMQTITTCTDNVRIVLDAYFLCLFLIHQYQCTFHFPLQPR